MGMFESEIWNTWTQMRMFNGPVWCAWLGLLLMMIGLVATLPVEGGRMTPRLLGAVVGTGALFYLHAIPVFPFSIMIRIALALTVLVCFALTIREARVFGAVCAAGEVIMGYGALLLFRSLFFAAATILVVIAIHWIRNR